jgi:8-oxo-dGTP diphosphatase
MNKLFEVSTTAIIFNEDQKMLITRRSLTKKRWPGLWVVPGGHIEEIDYKSLTANIDGVWYKVIENAVKREVREEVGIEITDIGYLTDMVLDDGKVFVISMVACHSAGVVTLDKSECDEFAWVTAEEAKNYKLIAGIQEELELAEDQLY